LKRYRQIHYWAKKWRFYVAFFLVGIIVTSVGAVLFYVSINSPTYSYDPYYQGFGVARNSTTIPSFFVINFVVDPPELVFEYFYTAQTNGTYNFIFVFPFHVTSIIRNSTNMMVNSTNTCTVISLRLDSIKQGSQEIWADFEIKRTFLSANRGLYTVVPPFGRGISDGAYDSAYRKLGVGLNPLDATVELYVSLPNSYSYTESVPTITDMNPFVNQITNKSLTSLHWVFTELQNSVTIMCTDQSEIDYLQNVTFWSGILFGIGFSLMLNTVYDAYKKRVEKAEKK
jgi:hypothetical protein